MKVTAISQGNSEIWRIKNKINKATPIIRPINIPLILNDVQQEGQLEKCNDCNGQLSTYPSESNIIGYTYNYVVF